ncbi:threonine aspartase 1-like isoform X4 [Biomphalaria glabrata]|nr:threonine aspartase 1-like isoform X4 [Biomphalaria glabrata]
MTVTGTVECDASVMDGETLHFGAVGALSGVANPVVIASRLVEEQKLGPLPYGRVRPSILVGKGAQQFCVDRGIGITDNLVSVAALKTFRHYSRKCLKSETTNCTHKLKKRKLEIEESTLSLSSVNQSPSADIPRADAIHDTVGAVCVDHFGNVAAAASSGGIWLKHAGRLGASAVYGAGCWAQNQMSDIKTGVAAVTSGCGEQLMKTLLAKTSCDSVRSSDNLTHSLANSFKDSFLESEFLKPCNEKFAGILLLRTVQNENREGMFNKLYRKRIEKVCLTELYRMRIEKWKLPGFTPLLVCAWATCLDTARHLLLQCQDWKLILCLGKHT